MEFIDEDEFGQRLEEYIMATNERLIKQDRIIRKVAMLLEDGKDYDAYKFLISEGYEHRHGPEAD